MYEKNPVGKKVNLLENCGSYSRKMTDEVCEIVSVVPWSKELNDWCQHYIVRKPDGSEVEIREAECVFSPDYTKKYIEDTIHQFLNDNGVWSEVFTECDRKVIVVSIEWGDWRHSHMWGTDLMRYLGYREIGYKVTEEDGSDCYSAEHYFLKG